MRRIKKVLLLSFLTIVFPEIAVGAPESVVGCFVRNYTDAHLAKHPDQLVTNVRLLVRRTAASNSKYEFFLDLKVRGRNETLGTAGLCPDEAPGFRCFVDCDGGGIYIRPQSSHMMMYLERITMKKTCDMNPEDVKGSVEVTGGLDDRVFRIDRVNDAACRDIKIFGKYQSLR